MINVNCISQKEKCVINNKKLRKIMHMDDYSVEYDIYDDIEIESSFTDAIQSIWKNDYIFYVEIDSNHACDYYLVRLHDVFTWIDLCVDSLHNPEYDSRYHTSFSGFVYTRRNIIINSVAYPVYNIEWNG